MFSLYIVVVDGSSGPYFHHPANPLATYPVITLIAGRDPLKEFSLMKFLKWCPLSASITTRSFLVSRHLIHDMRTTLLEKIISVKTLRDKHALEKILEQTAHYSSYHCRHT